MDNSPKAVRLAVLIDAENLSPALVKPILVRLQTGNSLILKRAYGDWSKPQISGWKPIVLEFGIQSIHAPTYAVGKNSADIALVIDAVDLLHHHSVDCFCIISNDSDFTPLVHRINESGAKVIGVGSAKASQAFTKACHKFICLAAPAGKSHETAKQTAEAETQPLLQVVPNLSQSAHSSSQSSFTPPNLAQKEICTIVKQAYQELAGNGDWVTLSNFHTQVQKVCLKNLKLKFSSKLFGCTNLTQLVERSGIFEWDVSQSTTATSRRFRLKKAA